MFDGSYKRRRNIDLSTRRKTTSILEQSRQQRIERQRKEQENRAARTVQRWLRGILGRRRVLEDLRERIPIVSFYEGLSSLNLLLRWDPTGVQYLPRLVSGIPAHSIDTEATAPLAHRVVEAVMLSVLQAYKGAESSVVSVDEAFALVQFCCTRASPEAESIQCPDVALLAQACWYDPIRWWSLATAMVKTPIDQAWLGLIQLRNPALQPNHRPSLTSFLSSSENSTGKLWSFIDTNREEILVGVLDKEKDESVLLLLQHLVSPRMLALVATVAAHGRIVLPERINDTLMDDSDSDDDDDEEQDRVRQISQNRWTKQELPTVPQCDRLYKSSLEEWVQSELCNISHSDRSFALQLGQPQVWLDWGMAVLPSKGASAWVDLMARVLASGVTGLNTRQSGGSPLLTKLAFAPGLIERFWQYIQGLEASPTLYRAWAAFCDVFAHALIATRDELFQSSFVGESAAIPATDVILQLKELLYELYWTNPILADDVTAASSGDTVTSDLGSSRVHLLLSGTKLWNSLYERWCRMLRTSPFGEETMWLFSSTSLVTGDGAIVGPDDMEIDSGTNESPSEESDALGNAFRDPRMARILSAIPQALSFARRVRLFSSLIRADKNRTQNEEREMHAVMVAMMNGREQEISSRERISVHRDQLYEDSKSQLNELGRKLRRKVQVTFFNQHGAQEAGIDGGGVFKEFIDDLIKDAFLHSDGSTSPRRLFSVSPQEMLVVNPELSDDLNLLSDYEFLGRVLGKAVYESILVEPQFCLPFLNQLLGKTNSLEDLKNYDRQYYQNLTKLLSLRADEVEGLGLTFEVTVGSGSSMKTITLLPHGNELLVTKQNVVQYVHLVAHHMLNVRGQLQVKAFLRGFRDLVPAPWIRLFSAYELQKLIGGDDSAKGVDLESFKASMQYAGGYHPSQPVIQWFWEVVAEMDAEHQQKLLKFMTSCSRQPLLGFSSLEPAPCLQQIRLPDSLFQKDPLAIFKEAPLPTASTCMNLLKLPAYRSKELMRQKLLTAIEAGAGFELT